MTRHDPAAFAPASEREAGRMSRWMPDDEETIEQRATVEYMGAWEEAHPEPVAVSWDKPLSLLADAWRTWDDILATASAYPRGDGETPGWETRMDPEVLAPITGAHFHLGEAITLLTGTTPGSCGNDPVGAIEHARAAEGFMLAARWGYGWMVCADPSQYPPEVFKAVCEAVDAHGAGESPHDPESEIRMRFADAFAVLVANMPNGGRV